MTQSLIPRVYNSISIMRKSQSILELELGDAQDVFMDDNQMKMDEVTQNERESMASISGSFRGVAASRPGGRDKSTGASHRAEDINTS